MTLAVLKYLRLKWSKLVCVTDQSLLIMLVSSPNFLFASEWVIKDTKCHLGKEEIPAGPHLK